MLQSKHYLDYEGVKYLASKLDDYPDNTILSTVIAAIDNLKANKDEIPQIIINSTENFNSDINMIGELDAIYIYTDHQQNADGKNIPGIKIGDGKAFLIDTPFIDDLYMNHINNTTIHITDEERTFWNNKVRCYLSDSNSEQIVFTTL